MFDYESNRISLLAKLLIKHFEVYFFYMCVRLIKQNGGSTAMFHDVCLCNQWKKVKAAFIGIFLMAYYCSSPNSPSFCCHI